MMLTLTVGFLCTAWIRLDLKILILTSVIQLSCEHCRQKPLQMPLDNHHQRGLGTKADNINRT